MDFTKQEKQIIDEQNELLKDFFLTKFKEVPFSISRDNRNRVIAVFGKPDQNIIQARMLGLVDSKKPNLRQVAMLDYDFEDERTVRINNLILNRCFEGSNIDQILLQSFQNFASESGVKTINASIVPSNSMIEGFESQPDQFPEVKLDPLLITFLSNNFHRIFPYGKSFLKNPYVSTKYYLQNKSVKPIDVAHGVEPQTKESKIRKAFKPYSVQLEIAERYYNDNNPLFSPVYVNPNDVGTKVIKSLSGKTAEEQSSLH